jgi:hypothetical protein
LQPYITATGTDELDDLDDIIELLRASSESHSDDDDSWNDFKLQIEKRRKDFISGEEERKVSICVLRLQSLFGVHTFTYIFTQLNYNLEQEFGRSRGRAFEEREPPKRD